MKSDPIPGVPLEEAWEANLTMGTAWQYQPTHETYKSGADLIQRLIETRGWRIHGASR